MDTSIFIGIYRSLIKTAALNSDVELRKHQRDLVDFVMDNNGRALIAHGTGSGKTLSAIAAMEELIKRDKAKRALVVTPASLQENFYTDGVKKFTDSPVSMGLDGKSTYQIMSLSKFRRNPELALSNSKADTLIVDEIHRAKDKNSVTNRALVEASTKVDNLLGLTGSFISNHPKEVVPLLDIIDPHHELGSPPIFAKRYTKKEEYGKGGLFRRPKFRTELKKQKELGKKLQGKLHYLGHEDISDDLPEINIEDIHVPMSEEQTKLYNFSLGRLKSSSKGQNKKGADRFLTMKPVIYSQLF